MKATTSDWETKRLYNLLKIESSEREVTFLEILSSCMVTQP